MVPALFARLSRWGFDTERVVFGLRTALASSLALLVAWLVGLEHPQWSAMTVWAVSQPVRGMLVEKSLFRAAGTVLGTAVGVGLVLLAGGSLWVLVVGLAVWVGLCAGLGNLLGSLVGYGTLLAGYSASMVALLNTQQAEGQIWLLGVDRLLTVMTGVVVALLVGLLASARAEGELAGQVRLATARTFRLLARKLVVDVNSRGDAKGAEERLRARVEDLLASVARTEEAFEPHGAGSFRSRRDVRSLRAVVSAQVGGILWVAGGAPVSSSPLRLSALAATLEDIAVSLERLAPAAEVRAQLRRARMLCVEGSALAEVLRALARALDARFRYRSTGELVRPAVERVVLHRDWVSARHAWLRSTSLLLLVGVAWLATGWPAGAFVMLGTSVMITLFSTFDNPALIMGRIFFWQAVGAVAAVACRWLVWPLASSEFQLVLLLIPFILLGVISFAHRRTMLGAIDYFMVLLLLSQPSLPLQGTLSDSVAIALAVVAGPLLAYVAFRLVLPVDADHRQRRLAEAMVGELASIAVADAGQGRQGIWRLRLYHRLLKLVGWAGRTGDGVSRAVDGGLAIMQVGDAIFTLQRLRKDQRLSALDRRKVDAALRRLGTLARAPERAVAVMGRVGVLMHRRALPEARPLLLAAQAIAGHSGLFARS